jgi:restriction system protein
MWKVTAGRNNTSAEQFIEQNVVAIGWAEAGDYSSIPSKEILIQLFSRVWPDKTEKQNSVGAGQAWRFMTVFNIGDRVLTYNSDTRLYHVGTITGEPVYRPDQNERLPLQRAVKWQGAVSRDNLSQQTRNTLGAIMAIFKLSDDAEEEIERLLVGERKIQPAFAPDDATMIDDTVVSDPYADIGELAFERVKDSILKLDWEEMEELVAALLRALGYRTIVSPKGADRGRDVIASRDGFGFERPRIVIEVKHRKGQMGAPEIRSFLQTLHHEDRGLYVSTGGFSKEAHYQAENANSVTHLMSIDGLTSAILEQYGQFDELGKATLPLQKIYWPK